MSRVWVTLTDEDGVVLEHFVLEHPEEAVNRAAAEVRDRLGFYYEEEDA